VFVLLLISDLSFSDNHLRVEYSNILKSECQIKSKDERDLTWGCIEEKTLKIDSFRAKLEKLISNIIISHKGNVSLHKKEIDARLAYDNKLNDLIYELFFIGVDATTASFKVKQYIAKQKVELYLHILLDYYVFDKTIK
jgi:hypothetical protein